MRRLPAIVLVALVAACGHGPSDAGRREAQMRDLAKEAGLPRDAREVFAAAAGAVGETFQVTYGAGSNRLVVTRRGSDLRVDAGTDQRVVVRGDVTYQCTRSQGAWGCERSNQPYTGPGALGADTLRQLLRGLRQAKGAYEFRSARRTVAGTPARCVTAAAKQGGVPGTTLCVSPEGVPLLVENGTSSVRAVRYRTSVAADAFRLPAAARG